jgi:hypothetical protein
MRRTAAHSPIHRYTPVTDALITHLNYQSRMDSQPSGAGASKKATVYVAGLSPEVNEQQLLDAFVTFGEFPFLPPCPVASSG